MKLGSEVGNEKNRNGTFVGRLDVQRMGAAGG